MNMQSRTYSAVLIICQIIYCFGGGCAADIVPRFSTLAPLYTFFPSCSVHRITLSLQLFKPSVLDQLICPIIYAHVMYFVQQII